MWLNYFINMFFSLGLFLNAALFVSKAIQLYRLKNAQSFSLLKFGGLNLIQIFTALHGFLVKDYLLAIGFCLSIITSSTLTAMIIFYKKF